MLVSKDTTDKMSDLSSLDLRYLGNIQVAGVSEVKEVYEVLDCLPDDERQRRRDNKDDLNESVMLYAEGKTKEAEETLRRLVSSGKNDHVIDMYLNYLSNLPEDGRTGVFRFVRK